MATASAIRKFRNRTQPFTGCRASYQKPSGKRATGIGSDGFLNQTFRPFWAMKLGNYKETETAFFRSLANLRQLYDIPRPDLGGVIYPQNVAEAFEHVQDYFKKGGSKTECMIVQDEVNPATIVTLKNYDTRQTLYYIPVHGLWQILQCKRLEPLANMLYSVFAYLYQVVEIPFFADHGSYLYYEYELISDWIDDDEGEIEEEYIEQQRQDLILMKYAGGRILDVIRQAVTLEQLEYYTNAYCNSDCSRKEIRDFAEEAVKLHREYPGRSIFKNMKGDIFETEDTNYTRADQYIGFYWSCYDTINEQLFEVINNELQENSYTEEPAFIQFFNEPQERIEDNFDFEARIFDLLNNLCDILIPYDNGEHQ